MRETLDLLQQPRDLAPAAAIGGVASAGVLGVETYGFEGALGAQELPGAELVTIGAGSVAANQSPSNTVSCNNCTGNSK